jgi:lipoprotein-anchoring transpeptidase ErfK/SrfK
MMSKKLSRRAFLKLGAAAFTALPFNPFPLPQDEYDYPSGEIGRVAIPSISIFREAKVDAETVAYRFRDEIVHIVYELIPPTGPIWNPLWYRIWGGYAHSAYIQRAKIRFNTPLSTVRETGQLCEVTVPYTYTYRYDVYNGWVFNFRLYYKTTHWAIGIAEGPDKQPWYKLYDETYVEYFVPASHMRPIPDTEISPISADVPWEKKRIEVSIQEQTLTAYEYDKIVLQTKISSGMPSYGETINGIPTDTPTGQFNILSKLPSKHMGDARLTGAPDAYNLPGVPWTLFFHETGVAFHGAYWHNNFGVRMSHGCVNMRPDDAKWLFRWCDPKFDVPVKERTGWEKRGYGTMINIE